MVFAGMVTVPETDPSARARKWPSTTGVDSSSAVTPDLGANTPATVLKSKESPAVTVVVLTERGGGGGGYGCAEAACAPISGAPMRMAVDAADTRAARHLRVAVIFFNLLDLGPGLVLRRPSFGVDTKTWIHGAKRT
jgi:hypothetical protein